MTSQMSVYWAERLLEEVKRSSRSLEQAYEQGRADGVRSMEGHVRIKVTGKQFIARLMTQVSPDSEAWRELHAIAERGFGNSLEVSDD